MVLRRGRRPFRAARGHARRPRGGAWRRRDDRDRQPPRVGPRDDRLLQARRGSAAVHRAAAREGPAPAGRRGAPERDPRRRARSRWAAGDRGPGSCGARRVAVRRRARADRGPRPLGPVPDHVHERHRGRAEGCAPRPALPVRPAPAGRPLARPGARRARVVHRRERLVEVGPQRVHRTLADGCRRAAPRCPLRPARAPRAAGARARGGALHGAHRVPRDRQAGEPGAAARAARAGGSRRGAQPRGAPRVGGGDGAADPRRLRPDRDRPAHRRARRRLDTARLDGTAPRRHRAGDRGGRAGGRPRHRAHLLPRLHRRAGAAPRRRVLAGRGPARGRGVADRGPGET